VVYGICFGVGIFALAWSGMTTWRAQAALRRQAATLSALAGEEGEQLQALAERLNRDGFELQHTLETLSPKVDLVMAVLRRPMVSAAIPWMLRRLAGRPLRRHG
jgi:hypothetical protein